MFMRIESRGFSIDPAIERYTKPIIIKDAMMGTGKSTGIIKELNSKVKSDRQHDEPTLIVLPYLKEIKRYKDECPGMDFKVPSTDNGCTSKSEDLKRLLNLGENILCTHKLFELWDHDVASLIERGYYHIIIAEEVSCLKPLKTTATTIRELKTLKLIDIDPDTKRVVWEREREKLYKTSGEYDAAKEHQKVRMDCLCGSVYMYGKEDNSTPFMVWEVPYRFFQIARSYTILTYRFDSSELAAFFRTHDIKYKIENVDPKRQAGLIATAKELISIIDPPPTVQQLTKGRNSLSINWYKNACTKKNMESIRNSISNYLRRIPGVRAEDVIYTCPKEYSTAKGRAGKKHMAIPSYKNRHIPWTTKGTNDYRHCNTVVYIHNVFPNVNVQKYLNDKGANWNDNEYALSCLLQFLWRSCIRDGKPVRIMIVNTRMRKLFEDWLNI